MKSLIVALAFVLTSHIAYAEKKLPPACEQAVDDAIQIREAARKASEVPYQEYQKSKPGLEFDRTRCEYYKADVADMEISIETALGVEKACGKRLAAQAFPRCDSSCFKKWIVAKKKDAKEACDSYEAEKR